MRFNDDDYLSESKYHHGGIVKESVFQYYRVPELHAAHTIHQ